MIGKNFIKVLLFLVLVIASDSLIFAQNEAIDVNNIQNINVDDLSDEQIRQFINEVDKRGLTDSQIELLARSRGVSNLQLQKLRERVDQIRQGRVEDSSSSKIIRERESVETNRISEDNPYNDLFSAFQSQQEEVLPQNQIFGFDLFKSKDLTFQPSLNIPTPENYRLGAGDNIIIDIWGVSEKTYQLQISPEGSIRIPNLGPIYLNGLSIEQATAKINDRLKKIFSSLGENTYSDISLGQLRTITVHIVGEASNQGSYTLSSFATVFNALYYAGGPNENGSLRYIDLYRNNKKIETIDVYDFLFNGVNKNINLQDQDMIIVRPYKNRVQIKGEVKRQGYYEINADESLADLLSYAGDFTGTAYSESITIKRNKGLKRSIETIRKEDFSNFELKNGDVIIVGEIIDRFENMVQISGSVNKPGQYEFNEGETLSQLINKAEGVTEDAFYNRGIILRLNDDFTTRSISFDLNKVLNGEDIKLQNEDFVVIKSIFDLREKYVVSIQGEIRKQGDYIFIDSMTVEDLILQAGGVKETAARSIVEVARRKEFNDKSDISTSARIFNFGISENLELSESASSFILKPFDLVVIRKSPYYEKQQIVEIQGEANFPGKYVIEKKNERISDLLSRGGGLTNYAYVKGATLIRRTEYFSNEASELAKLRRENLKELAQRDTLLSESDVRLKDKESIGINLEEIIKSPGSKYDLILKEGDVLGIPKQLQTVRLRGELLYPSIIRYDKSNSFKDYISQSGGYTDVAKPGKSYVLYANGEVKRTKKILLINVFPKIEPGAEVIIPKRPDKRKITPGEIIGLTTGVATFGLIILRLIDFLETN